MVDRFVIECRDLFAEGGPFFWWLIALAFGIAFALLSIWRALSLADMPGVPGSGWGSLLAAPHLPRERVEALRREIGADDLDHRLDEIDRRLFDLPARRIPFAFVLISAAPLIGLLGTVSGMFRTFDGMAAANTSAPVDVISRGISEALITTEAGLVIGVPSFIVCALLKTRFDRLRLGYQRLVSALSQPPRA
ncbi:MAG: MotA/TolQ/ExbB proton channel family protein [Verrucomicrobiales bacterium]|nr:MotA/TolQ/ExbB proton channel family protein [Verrucomicrobiales bacterium]